MAILMKLDQVIWITNCCIYWRSVLSVLFVKCIYDYIFTYIAQLVFHLCWVILSIALFLHDFRTTDYTQAHWQELPSALDSSSDKSDLTFGRFHKYCYNLRILVESYMPPHRMITQLRTVYSEIVHNSYWYTDYTHCSWINNAMVTRHGTWSAYENYVWLTVTSS